jgi:hypothetical protein
VSKKITVAFEQQDGALGQSILRDEPASLTR